jgi:hypothetical protein
LQEAKKWRRKNLRSFVAGLSEAALGLAGEITFAAGTGALGVFGAMLDPEAKYSTIPHGERHHETHGDPRKCR